jgi:uncharacterized protein YjbI with pentapeptide repeats
LKLVNPNDFTVAAVPSLAASDGPELTVVAKATYRLVPDGTAEPAEEQRPPTGELFEDDDRARPLLYPGDFAPFKPRADLLLVGTAHAPGRAPVPELTVTFEVGDRGRTLRVFGDREWTGRLLRRRRPSDPLPFASMPLDYARSFGGSSLPENPLGLGVEPVEDDLGRSRRPLPNIEDPTDPLRGPTSRPQPAGFGPLPDVWPQRTNKAGRFPRSYREQFWPSLPPDFDWSYFNAAPETMQVDYLRGDEWIQLTNLHPERATYRCRLPGIRVRCFLEDARENGEQRVREANLRLDTLWVDADAEELVLVWRGRPGIRSKEADEVTTVWFVSEDLGEQPLPAAGWVERLRAERDAAGQGEAPAPEPEPELDEDQSAALAGLEKEMGKFKDQLAAGGVPAALLAKLDFEGDPELFLDGLFDHLGVDRAQGERIRAESEARFARMLEEAGEDPTLLQQMKEPPPPDSSALRALVENRHAAGSSLAEEDLSGVDLTGADLAGADFRGAILAGARFDGANLEGADLRDANLSEASFEGARLGSANLSRADLTRARLTGGDLTGASLVWAVADGACFEEARLIGVEGEHLRAMGCDLSRADLSSARLVSANFEGATLDATILASARLESASIQGASGEATDLRGADCTRLRASDGTRLSAARLEGLVGPDSMWANADLSGSDFRRAELSGSDFSGCILHGVSFVEADLGGANLSKSELDQSVCAHANFFQGNFYAARIGRADLSHANLFGAETDDAHFEEATLEGANVARTRLEG